MVACPGNMLFNGKGLWIGYVVDNYVSNIRLQIDKTKSKSQRALTRGEQVIDYIFCYSTILGSYIGLI